MSPDSTDVMLSVSEFVDLLNQTLDYALSGVVITGELANLRVSKNRWLYFDLKDENCTVKFFGTVYQLPGPLEDGMMLRVKGNPRLHNQYGFSVNVTSIQPAGEGTIKRAAALLQAKLEKEGLFDPARKRPIPYPPKSIGLIASKQSAAYADFIKIINARWQGIDIQLIDVQVQGDVAVPQITSAIEQFNAEALTPEVLILIRGGGSPEDMAAFSSEQVTRAVAASRVPTLVAIGHEIDICLAELAADQRASTPSNAAELLVPDRGHALKALPSLASQLAHFMDLRLSTAARDLQETNIQLEQIMQGLLSSTQRTLVRQKHVLTALSPQSILKRGYAIVRTNNVPLRSVDTLKPGGIVDVQVSRGEFKATVTNITKES